VGLESAFEALRAAVEDGEDEVARAILLRLMPRISDPLSADLAAGYSNVLAGRLARDAVMGVVRVVELESGGFSVSLALSQALFDDVTLRPGHVLVQAITRSIDIAGHQSTRVSDRLVEAGDGWALTRDQVLSVPMGSDSPLFGEGFLAVRCEWKVVLGAGSVETPSGVFPLMGVQVDDGSVVRLSRELPTQVVEPVELARYCLEPVIRPEGLLERAVRISPSLYAEALDLLAESAPALPPARLEELIPALAWLTGGSVMRASGHEWREWLRLRALAGDRSESLDLPDASMGSDNSPSEV
jgi:hypothetical protein